MTGLPRSSSGTNTLLPCPFCGGEAVDRREIDGFPMIYCDGDDCFGPQTTAKFFEDALVQWNTRAPDHRESAKQELAHQAQALDMGYGGDRAECQDPWVDPTLTKLAEGAAKRIARAEQLDSVSAKEIYRVIMGALVESRGDVAKSLNQEAADHPTYDNPRDAFASPDRLPAQALDMGYGGGAQAATPLNAMPDTLGDVIPVSEMVERLEKRGAELNAGNITPTGQLMLKAAFYIKALGAAQPRQKPFAWVMPGSDTANDRGFIDAMAWEEGEFTKPLYAADSAQAEQEPAICTTNSLVLIRNAVVMAIAFLGRDAGSDRAAATTPQIIKALANADTEVRRVLALSSTQSASPTIDDVPSCGQENDHRRARSLCSCKASARDGQHMAWCPVVSSTTRETP